jgi:dimethylaniline monooxygenase (N-oxide forming)
MTAHRLSPDGRVAVIGGGPSGIIAAKELAEAGLAPVIYERSRSLGGQWNAGAPHSGVWPGMRANTSGSMTCFSEAPAPAGWPLFPRAELVRDHLVAYAERHELEVRLGVSVTAVRPVADSWEVAIADEAADTQETERVAGVVAASGRFATPAMPAEKTDFASRVQISHAAAYRGRDRFRGRRVLVVGNSISGLEIAADLAQDPSITVISSARRARWIIPKLAVGVPADQRWFTAFAALLGRTLAPAELAGYLASELQAQAGNPAAVGGLQPDPDLLVCGLAQCQSYLPLVAEGRIDVRPGIAAIAGDAVRFADGTYCVVDQVLFATGYERTLPYLANAPAPGDLVLETLDPARSGLGVMGQYVLHGAYLPVLELQARWLAGVWTGINDIQSVPPVPPALPYYPHHVLAEAFAMAAGVWPDPDRYAALTEALRFGPMLPERYRIASDPAAAQRFATATAGFSAPAEQIDLYRALTADNGGRVARAAVDAGSAHQSTINHQGEA